MSIFSIKRGQNIVRHIVKRFKQYWSSWIFEHWCHQLSVHFQYCGQWTKNLISNNPKHWKIVLSTFSNTEKGQKIYSLAGIDLSNCWQSHDPSSSNNSNIMNWSQIIGSKNRYIWPNSIFVFKFRQMFYNIFKFRHIFYNIFKLRQISQTIFNLRQGAITSPGAGQGAEHLWSLIFPPRDDQCNGYDN